MSIDYDSVLKSGDIEKLLEMVRTSCKSKLFVKNFNSFSMEHDDVIQEVLTKVYNSLDLFDSSRGMLSTFIDRVIESKINDCYKKSSRRYNTIISESSQLESGSTRSDSDDCDINPTSYSIGSYDSGYRLVEIVNDLKSSGLSEVEISVLKFKIDGYKSSEIASTLGYTPARICQLLKKTRDVAKGIV